MSSAPATQADTSFWDSLVFDGIDDVDVEKAFAGAGVRVMSWHSDQPR
ncbi:hypothetical protein [Streptomyces sirii]